jgi:hypothetical protein
MTVRKSYEQSPRSISDDKQTLPLYKKSVTFDPAPPKYKRYALKDPVSTQIKSRKTRSLGIRNLARKFKKKLLSKFKQQKKVDSKVQEIRDDGKTMSSKTFATIKSTKGDFIVKIEKGDDIFFPLFEQPSNENEPRQQSKGVKAASEQTANDVCSKASTNNISTGGRRPQLFDKQIKQERQDVFDLAMARRYIQKSVSFLNQASNEMKVDPSKVEELTETAYAYASAARKLLTRSKTRGKKRDNKAYAEFITKKHGSERDERRGGSFLPSLFNNLECGESTLDKTKALALETAKMLESLTKDLPFSPDRNNSPFRLGPFHSSQIMDALSCKNPHHVELMKCADMDACATLNDSSCHHFSDEDIHESRQASTNLVDKTSANKFCRYPNKTSYFDSTIFRVAKNLFSVRRNRSSVNHHTTSSIAKKKLPMHSPNGKIRTTSNSLSLDHIVFGRPAITLGNRNAKSNGLLPLARVDQSDISSLGASLTVATSDSSTASILSINQWDALHFLKKRSSNTVSVLV